MKHKRIEFSPGITIEYALAELKEYNDKGELVFGEFNGQKIYSDTDTTDSAYKKITGKTKYEFDEESRKINENYELEKKNHEDHIPELINEWIEKGALILDNKYLSFWNKIVPVRLRDLYRGMELGCCLDIVKELNSGCDFDKAKNIILDQGHSGMSFSIVCSMIKSFSDRGNEFIEFINSKNI